MEKNLEMMIYQLVNSEYYLPLLQFIDDLNKGHDIQMRGIDPHRDPGKISRRQGMIEGNLILKEELKRFKEGGQ